jgi:hypothetical protein
MTDDIQEVTVHIAVIQNGTVHMYWNTRFYVHDSEGVLDKALEFVKRQGHNQEQCSWAIVGSLIERHNEYMG